MVGARLQFGRNHGVDRFYVPAKGRRSHQNQLQQEQLRRAQNDVTASKFPLKKEKSVGVEAQRDVTASKFPLKKEKSVGVEPVVLPLCNLERFLGSITPSVPAQYLSKTTMRGWRTCDVESQPFFELGDLWESFKEWSAYGAGVPLVLDGSDGVIQYYVPYLSGIQIYGDASESPVNSRRPGEESDIDYLKYLREQQNHHHLPSEIALGPDRLSLTDQHIALQEDSSSDDGEVFNSQGCLLFEYYEQDPPLCRKPLADKISDLAFRFPELKTLRSCDLLSSSWISVAWYPIYRIPMDPMLKDMNACFLTFHSLHTPVRGVQAPMVTCPSEVDGSCSSSKGRFLCITHPPKISLPVFGLATYKFKGSLWSPNGGSEHHLVNSLLQAADSWLRLLQVNHPDFLFFCRR